MTIIPGQDAAASKEQGGGKEQETKRGQMRARSRRQSEKKCPFFVTPPCPGPGGACKWSPSYCERLKNCLKTCLKMKRPFTFDPTLPVVFSSDLFNRMPEGFRQIVFTWFFGALFVGTEGCAVSNPDCWTSFTLCNLWSGAREVVAWRIVDAWGCWRWLSSNLGLIGTLL